jgi:hypothetical protein
MPVRRGCNSGKLDKALDAILFASAINEVLDLLE